MKQKLIVHDEVKAQESRSGSEYSAPKLKEWGSVADITEVGHTNPGGDMHGGSVNPPGHVNNPGLGT